MGKITLDSEEIARLCETAEGFVLDASAEESLCKLLEVQESVNALVEKVKESIVEKALAIDSDFTSISGDRLKAEYRAYGAEFAIDDIDAVDKAFLNIKEKAELDVASVKEYERLTGKLPKGVIRKERKRTLTIKRK